jgi:hypothetical protein
MQQYHDVLCAAPPCFLQQELRGKLLAEAEASAAANAEVAVRWGAVLGLDVPQELFQAIEEQRMACEAVIASKDRLIAGALEAADWLLASSGLCCPMAAAVRTCTADKLAGR